MNTRDHLPEFIYRYTNNAVWIGSAPLLNLPALSIYEASNCRADSMSHGRYQSAYIIEYPLSHLKQWALVLDETLRVLKDDAHVTIAFHNVGPFASNAVIKQFMGRRYNTQVTQVEAWCDHKTGRNLVSLRVIRNASDRYRTKTWTFCMLTNGNKEKVVEAFCKSVRNQKNGGDHEILICCPSTGVGLNYGARYVYPSNIVEPWGEISRKKNFLAQVAAGANLVLLHDRYILSDGFVESFDRYGYDFDYLTVRQKYENGSTFPCLNGINNPPLMWGKVWYADDFTDYPPNAFVNGGFIVAKRDTLRDIQFNDLSHWNQAEDVELAIALRQSSIIPRVNTHAEATTVGITNDYTKTITKWPNNSFRPMAYFHALVKLCLLFVASVSHVIYRLASHLSLIVDNKIGR